MAGVITLAGAHPWAAAAIAAVLLVAEALLAIWALRRLSRLKTRYDAWGERVGLAQAQRRGSGPPRGGPAP